MTKSAPKKKRDLEKAYPVPKKKRDLEKAYPVSEFIAKLRRLADALEAGKPFTIQVAGERLRIPADAVFNIEHERDGGREELEFQLRWQTPAHENNRKPDER